MSATATGPGETLLPDAVSQLLGQRCHECAADCRVTREAVRALCAAVQDPNPLWWEVADEAAEGRAPAPMLSVWARPELWLPSSGVPFKALQLHYDIKELLDFPAAIVSSMQAEFHAPVRMGDRLRSWQTLCSISAEKSTRLGRGRFWELAVHYVNQHDELLGIEHYRCFGYRDHAAAAASKESAPAQPSGTPRGMPALRCRIDTTTVVAAALATRDYSPLHHDARYAREVGGHPDVFLNTPTQAAFIGRYISERLGERARIGRLATRMGAPVYAGSEIVIEGDIVNTSRDAQGCNWLELAITLSCDGIVATHAEARVAVAQAGDDPWQRCGEAWQP